MNRHQSIAEAACVQETQRQQYELVNWWVSVCTCVGGTTAVWLTLCGVACRLADAVLADIMEECTGEVSATIDGVADDLVEVL